MRHFYKKYIILFIYILSEDTYLKLMGNIPGMPNFPTSNNTTGINDHTALFDKFASQQNQNPLFKSPFLNDPNPFKGLPGIDSKKDKK